MNIKNRIHKQNVYLALSEAILKTEAGYRYALLQKERALKNKK